MSTFRVLGNYGWFLVEEKCTFNLENIESENICSGRDLTEHLTWATRKLGPGEAKQLACDHAAGLSFWGCVWLCIWNYVSFSQSVNKHCVLLCQTLDEAEDTAVTGQERPDEWCPHLLRLSESLVQVTEPTPGWSLLGREHIVLPCSGLLQTAWGWLHPSAHSSCAAVLFPCALPVPGPSPRNGVLLTEGSFSQSSLTPCIALCLRWVPGLWLHLGGCTSHELKVPSNWHTPPWLPYRVLSPALSSTFPGTAIPGCLWKTRPSLLASPAIPAWSQASHTPPCTSISSSATVGQKILQVPFGCDILWLHWPAWGSGHSPHLWLQNPEEGAKETQTNKQTKQRRKKKNPEEQGELSVKSLKAHSVICLAPWLQGKSAEALRAPGSVGEQRCVWTCLLPLTPALSPESPPCCPALTQALDSKMGSQSSHLETWGGKIKKGRKDSLPKKYHVSSI